MQNFSFAPHRRDLPVNIKINPGEASKTFPGGDFFLIDLESKKTCTGFSKQKSICPTNPVHLMELFIAFYGEWDINLFSGSPPTLPMSYGTNTRRKPTLLLRLPGLALLRFAERQFCALLFQLPPRNTRFEPSIDARMSNNLQNFIPPQEAVHLLLRRPAVSDGYGE